MPEGRGPLFVIKYTFEAMTCNLTAWKKQRIYGKSTCAFLGEVAITHREAWRFSVSVFIPRSWKQLWIKNAFFLALFKHLCDIFQGKHDADPTVVIFSLFPCAFFLLLQTCGRCCGLCCYSMRWAASRASGVSPRVSETASSSWRWTAPSTPTPPASTSRPAWSCATGRHTSEPVPGSLCRQ